MICKRLTHFTLVENVTAVDFKKRLPGGRRKIRIKILCTRVSKYLFSLYLVDFSDLKEIGANGHECNRLILRIIDDNELVLVVAAIVIFGEKQAAFALFRFVREDFCGFFPAHAVVCGFGHTY